jgi:hypothetical protein
MTDAKDVHDTLKAIALSDATARLLGAPYGHWVRRDTAGNSHVTLYDAKGVELITIVAPTFDEAVTRALDFVPEVTHDGRE